MWKDGKNFPATPRRTCRSAPCSPMQPLTEKNQPTRADSFHAVHKVPSGDSPYVKAKHVQLIDKDPSKAISLFWSAINSGDRVDSALKDMAIVMKQLNRTDEAIEAIKSFRHLCTLRSQESLDNVLIDLYKRGGRIEEHIELLQHKLKLVEDGAAFGGKRTKIARSQGKKFHVSMEQERSRILGNLAWAYMQQENYQTAEELYRKALAIEPDKNKQCNLTICLMQSGRTYEAKSLLDAVIPSAKEREIADPYIKSYDRALEMLTELESESAPNPQNEQKDELKLESRTHKLMTEHSKSLTSPLNRTSESLSSSNGEQTHCSALSASRRLIEDENEDSLLEKLPNKSNERWKQECLSGNHFEDGVNISDCNKRAVLQSDRSPLFADKWRKWNLTPNSFEKVSNFSGLKKGRCSFETRVHERSALTSSRRLEEDVHNDSFVMERSNNSSERWKQDSHSRNPRSGFQSFRRPLFSDKWKRGHCSSNSFGGMSDFSSFRKEKCASGTQMDEGYARQNVRCADGDQAGNALEVKGFTSHTRGKSWAAMVEEDELLSQCSDHPCHESSFYYQAPSKVIGRWNDEEAFQDENLNVNITSPTENIQRKLQAVDLGGGGGLTGTSDLYMYKSKSARKSLCFDQEPKWNKADQAYDSVAVSGSGSTWDKGLKPMRILNRLQVFQEMTLPDSPRV